jgi:TolB protein
VTEPVAWSPDSRQLAVPTIPLGSQEDTRILLASIGHTGVDRLGGPEVFGVHPAWSPDGNRIAFVGRSPCCSGILMADPDGSNLHALSPDQVAIPGDWTTGGGHPAWSPDGRHVAYLAALGGLNQVFVVGVDGGEPVNVSNSPEDVTGFSWSPDGTRIAYTRMRSAYGTDSVIVLVDPDGTNSLSLDGPPLLSGDAPIWSPDGKRVLGLGWSSPEVILAHSAGKDQIVAFDPSNRMSPTVFTVPRFNHASWQRLAP